MRKLILLAFVPILYSCSNSSSEKELELLRRENELLKKEQQLKVTAVNNEAKVLEHKTYLEKLNYRKNWDKYLTVKSNVNIDKFLGGFSSGTLTVTNNTNYDIDDATIRVSYIKDDGENYKVEIVQVPAIKANSSTNAVLPGSNRGTSLKFDFINISSNDLNFCYSEGMKIKDINDPYYCK